MMIRYQFAVRDLSRAAGTLCSVLLLAMLTAGCNTNTVTEKPPATAPVIPPPPPPTAAQQQRVPDRYKNVVGGNAKNIPASTTPVRK